MRLIKILGLTASLALAATAFVGVSAAFATPHIQLDTCMANGECKPASPGTVVHSHGENVKLSNGFITNTCLSDVSLEVLNTLSLGTQIIEAHIFEATYYNCNNFPVLVENLPWLLLISASSYPNGLVDAGARVTLDNVPFEGECTFEATEELMPTGKWTNGEPSTVTLGGKMKKVGGGGLCGSEGSITGTYKVGEVLDPELPEATNVKFLLSEK